MSYYKEERPWGSFENIFESDKCKVKKIIIKPNKRPSYQYHLKRSEIWHIIQGNGIVTLEGEDIEIQIGSSVMVPIGSKHRVFNNGETDLIFIEIQSGTYFGEDDIVRVEDDYGRGK